MKLFSNMWRGSARAAAGLLVSSAMLFCATAAKAQTPNFAGQRITLVVGTTTGGAYDFYGRLVARHIGRFLPGNPTVLATNMPGAGGVIELNWLANVAPKDGTAIGIVPMSAVFEALLGGPGSQAQYDARKFSWLASLNDYVGSAVVWHEAPFRTAKDLQQKEIVIGGGGAGSDITIWPNLFNALAGTKIKLVTGYVGTANVFLAMERGEVQGMFGLDWDGIKSSKGDWVRDKKIRVLLQIADKKHPDLPDVPSILDFAENKADREVLELFIGRQKYSRPFAGPPGMPAAVVAAYREAFKKLASDLEFLREAEQSNSAIKWVDGSEILASTERVYNAPPALIARATQELAKAKK